jgi:hypothetical protein
MLRTFITFKVDVRKNFVIEPYAYAFEVSPPSSIIVYTSDNDEECPMIEIFENTILLHCYEAKVVCNDDVIIDFST